MRLVIVDDDPIVSRSLATMLSAETDIEVCGTGVNGTEARQLYDDLAPDILLMDIQMAGGDGLDAAEDILARHPGARVVFLTTFSDDECVVRALRMGARGYLIKQDIATIAPALRSVMAGQSVLEGEVLERATTLSGSVVTGDESALAPFSQREREVVRLVSEGLDNSQIAARLFLSEGTVRNHISAILAKLALRNRTQIAVFYYKRCQ
ncbi:hypothetical protein HMPREF1008_00362 [Olsenella sp. oral taxon 809 str. F0356]|uniref:response regulator transcription factor n=1 Tax=Olsenella sp. oral taxon 809 TaxID=661086 RepID=UPI000231EFF4|nr:response regulator transcription factor [Olsenella sp. oral taxon 809]EHF02717.1 hypothetical protein HMPREF1008_00362 [Olsenella sp. oral taxon 809 str. F0356]